MTPFFPFSVIKTNSWIPEKTSAYIYQPAVYSQIWAGN